MIYLCTKCTNNHPDYHGDLDWMVIALNPEYCEHTLARIQLFDSLWRLDGDNEHGYPWQIDYAVPDGMVSFVSFDTDDDDSWNMSDQLVCVDKSGKCVDLESATQNEFFFTEEFPEYFANLVETPWSRAQLRIRRESQYFWVYDRSDPPVEIIGHLMDRTIWPMASGLHKRILWR